MTNHSVNLKRAMKAAEELPQTSSPAAGSEPGTDIAKAGEEAVAEALGPTPAVAKAHSQALGGRLIAEHNALTKVLDDLDGRATDTIADFERKLAALHEDRDKRLGDIEVERADAMHAYRGISAALAALREE